MPYVIKLPLFMIQFMIYVAKVFVPLHQRVNVSGSDGNSTLELERTDPVVRTGDTASPRSMSFDRTHSPKSLNFQKYTVFWIEDSSINYNNFIIISHQRTPVLFYQPPPQLTVHWFTIVHNVEINSEEREILRKLRQKRREEEQKHVRFEAVFLSFRKRSALRVENNKKYQLRVESTNQINQKNNRLFFRFVCKNTGSKRRDPESSRSTSRWSQR